MSNLFVGDTLDVINDDTNFHELKGKIRTAIFSPPYFAKRVYDVPGEIGLEKDGVDKYLGYLLLLIEKLFSEVLTPDGTVWLNIKDTKRNGFYLNIPEKLVVMLSSIGIRKTGCAAWVCSNMGPSSDKRSFTAKWEPFYSFAKSSDFYFNLDPTREKPIYPEKRKVREALLSGKGKTSGNPGAFLAANPKGKNPGNAAVFWSSFEPSDLWCHPKANNHVSENSATYPVELLRKPILAASDENDYVLDCFCGEGSTLVQAAWLGRIPVGIDANAGGIKRTSTRIEQTIEMREAYRKIALSDRKLFEESQ